MELREGGFGCWVYFNLWWVQNCTLDLQTESLRRLIESVHDKESSRKSRGIGRGGERNSVKGRGLGGKMLVNMVTGIESHIFNHRAHGIRSSYMGAFSDGDKSTLSNKLCPR